MKEFNRYKIVLCRPAEGGNVGSVCRAMKAMGLSRLSIVAPERELNMRELRNMAVHAFDLYEGAEFHDDLPSALADCALAAGTTRRRGQRRKTYSLSVQDFAAESWKREGDIAIVFGNERTGMTDEELDLCQYAVSIATSEDFPSLNLAQAVQIVCWELFRSRPEALFPTSQGAAWEEIARESGRMVGVMEGVGFFKKPCERGITEAFFRDLASRASLSQSELRLFSNLFLKAVDFGANSKPRPRSLRAGEAEATLGEKESRP